MRIQLASDLHLEFLARRFPRERLIAPAADADVLVLAGDIGSGSAALRLFADWPVPVLYVAGNHEAYGSNWESVIAELSAAAEGTAVKFLERQSCELRGVRFLGCTLWTDYRLLGSDLQRQAQEYADRHLNDHRFIQAGNGVRYSAADALEQHKVARSWLEHELSRPFAGKTVVITHHAPHPLSVHPKYADDIMNAAFVSDLPELLSHSSYWLHGHCHDSFDYRVDDCRVIANPRGYALNLLAAETAHDLRFENVHFNSACVIDTEAA